MKLVIDASVAVKWFLRLRPTETLVAEADAVGEVVQKPLNWPSY